ncbi:MAG: flagellin [Solibacillus sp.]
MRINHNIAALNTHRQLNAASAGQSKSMEKLASGLRINKAGDDAAGLAISEKMRGQIRGLDMASKNAQDGISLIATAEGALNETHSILQRQRELATQSANDTNTAEDRKNIQDEIDQLGKEIDRISSTTQFNTKNLIDGSMDKTTTAGENVNTNSSVKGAGGADILATTEVLNTLTDKDGNSLGIQTTDTITVTYVKNGEQQQVDLTGASTIADLVDAADGAITLGANGELIATADAAGYDGALHGISIEVKDTNGEVRSGASSALSSFAETTQATKDHSNGSATFQIGANTGQTIEVSIKDMSASALGVKDLKVGSSGQASQAIKVIDAAIQKVSAQRSSLGSVQNRLEHTINNLNTSSENLTAAESRIRDVDMAKEMMEQTKNSILSQAAQAMLAQSNQMPQGVLQLLR